MWIKRGVARGAELPAHLVPTVANGGIRRNARCDLSRGGDAAAATTCDLSCAPGFNLPLEQDSSFVKRWDLVAAAFLYAFAVSADLGSKLGLCCTELSAWRTGERVFVQCDQGYTARALGVHGADGAEVQCQDNGLFTAMECVRQACD